MDISFYFEPIDLEGYHTDRAIDRARLINRMEIFSDKDHFPKIDGLDIAIIGVTEDRAANGNKGCGESPERVRDFLFNLYSHWKHLRVADLGNITQGHHIDDTYFAIKEVLAVLLKNQVIPIIIAVVRTSHMQITPPTRT
ncbi:MAG: hypothetical protein P8100_05180 [bacterium]